MFPGWLGPPDVKFDRAWLGLPNEFGCCGVVGVGGSDVVGVTALGACVAGAAPFFDRGYFRISAQQTKQTNTRIYLFRRLTSSLPFRIWFI